MRIEKMGDLWCLLDEKGNVLAMTRCYARCGVKVWSTVPDVYAFKVRIDG